MRIAVAQIECAVGDVSRNVEKMIRLVAEAKQAQCDIVVFPEMSDTGYVMPVIVEKASAWTEGPVVALRKAAEANGINVIAGLSERDGKSVFNSLAIIDRSGKLRGKYRKTHLITANPICEHQYLAAGDELVIGSIDGITVGFMICYDTRFPEIGCALSNRGAKIIIIPSAFPLIRIAHWKILCQARAIENQLFVVGVNRIGTDSLGLPLGGASCVVNPAGVVLGSASETEEKLLIVDIDLAVVEATRKNVQILKDRRPDLYARPVKILPE